MFTILANCSPIVHLVPQPCKLNNNEWRSPHFRRADRRTHGRLGELPSGTGLLLKKSCISNREKICIVLWFLIYLFYTFNATLFISASEFVSCSVSVVKMARMEGHSKEQVNVYWQNNIKKINVLMYAEQKMEELHNKRCSILSCEYNFVIDCIPGLREYTGEKNFKPYESSNAIRAAFQNLVPSDKVLYFM